MRALSNGGLWPLACLKLISVSEHSIIMLQLVQHVLVWNDCFLALLFPITRHRQLDNRAHFKSTDFKKPTP